MKRLLHILLLLCALGFAHEASAQYYTWGSDPAGLKWSTIRTPDVRMIYPDTVSAVARRTLFYIRTVRPDIAFGFRHGPMRIPFVMHPENFQSNGLVMYLPKRVEFLTSPAIDGYSMPWYKQLVAHEYRHAVQYNNLDRGVIRALSYILGQQGSTIGLLCMPIWAMEGDAVMSETAMSSFGRGLQPSFSLGYRAMGRVGRDRKDTRDRRNIDKWFCGSYRDYIPDHYELGYQICSYAWERYGENIWDKVAWYGSRNPYVLATTRVALGKFYKTNVIKLFRETFDELERYWDSLPETGDSAVPLTALPEKNHTTYQWPLPLGDTAVVALKTDLGRWMTGNMGWLVTRVIHEKHTYKDYIGVDACAANLMRPAMYGAYHHITVCGKESLPHDHIYDVVGSLCENNDKFAIDRALPEIKIGDLLVIHDTGAHGHAMGYNYNGRLRSAEVLYTQEGGYKLIRRAETAQDYFATLDMDECAGKLGLTPKK